MHPAAAAMLALSAAGATGLGYAAGYEVRAFTLREVEVSVLPAGTRPLRVLHLSDLHLTPGQHKKQQWVRELADLEPDLVINTGDNLAHVDAVPPSSRRCRPCSNVPGCSCSGRTTTSGRSLKNPARYLLPEPTEAPPFGPRAALAGPAQRLRDPGWIDLTNPARTVDVGGLQLSFAGVDDPHLGYDRLDAVAGPRRPRPPTCRLGVTHAPYLRVLDAVHRVTATR